MASSTFGRSPLRGAHRLRGAIPRPRAGVDAAALATIVGDYLFGLDEQPAAAELAPSRIPDAAGGAFRWVSSWRTDVLRAYDGTEQRVATLPQPRHRYEGSFLLDDVDLRVVRQLLSANPAALYELPMPHEAVAAVVDVTGGSIYIDATYVDWNTQGRRIYVRGPAGDAYTTTITGASGGTLNVSSSPPVGGRFPAGLTIIYPIEEIRLEDGNGISRYPVSVGRWAFGGRAAARAVVGTGAPAAVTLDDLRVLDRRPTQQREAAEQVLGGVEFLDNGATMTSARSWSRSKHRRQLEWLIRSPADRQWWKVFLAERRGKWSACLVPTWRPDLVPWDHANGEAWIEVEGDYNNAWWPSLAHRRLQIELSDGSTIYRSVTSVEVSSSGFHHLILNEDMPMTGTMTRISFLETCRLDVDEIAVEFTQAWRGRISLPVITVQELEPVVPT